MNNNKKKLTYGAYSLLSPFTFFLVTIIGGIIYKNITNVSPQNFGYPLAIIGFSVISVFIGSLIGIFLSMVSLLKDEGAGFAFFSLFANVILFIITLIMISVIARA